jgi:hypothetical protein
VISVKVIILKPKEGAADIFFKIGEEIKEALYSGKNVLLQIDIGPPCPKCGGVSIDGGDMWVKQYGKRHRTCVECQYIRPEEK